MKLDLRDLAWLHSDRLVAYGAITFIALAPAYIFYFHLALVHGSDFYAFWSAAKLAASGAPHLAYSAQAMSAFQLQHFHSINLFPKLFFFPFLNPPPFLLIVMPLAFFQLPYALAIWIGTTFAAWMAAAAKLVRGSRWPLIAFPGAAIAAWHGQTGLLTGAIMIAAIHNLERRPALAGILFGLMVVKPQLAMLVPFALIAGRYYRVLWFACLSAAGLLNLSWAVFGSTTMIGFLGTTVHAQQLMHGFDKDALARMITVYASVKLAAGSVPAIAAQLAVTLCMAALVVRIWRGPVGAAAKGAVLVVANLLATPYAFAYDLPVLVLPICWIASEGRRSGFLPWEKLALVAIYWSPLVCRSIAPATHFVSMPVLLALTLFLLWRRLNMSEGPKKVRLLPPQTIAEPRVR